MCPSMKDSSLPAGLIACYEAALTEIVGKGFIYIMENDVKKLNVMKKQRGDFACEKRNRVLQCRRRI